MLIVYWVGCRTLVAGALGLVARSLSIGVATVSKETNTLREAHAPGRQPDVPEKLSEGECAKYPAGPGSG